MNNRVAALLVCVGSSLASTGAIAEACHEYSSGPIPDCQPQAQGPVKYSGWDTKGWAYYCTGDHPYFWGLADGFPGDFSTNNNCFSAIENEFYEGAPNKFDATFTNWCFKDEELVVTLGCSDVEPPGYQASCTHTTGGPVKDPGCPQSNAHNYCSTTNPPVCVQTFDETCGSTVYDCTIDLLVTWCFQCD
jgi:hypothetical protein